jgi:transcriptional regulator with XRE-family HTH domain
MHGTRIGATIRNLRTGRNLSLQDLSKLAGVSVGMLSQIERNLANPSLKILTKIQLALGTNAGAFFEDDPRASPEPDFVRRKDQRAFCDLGTLTKELLSSGASQHLEIMLLHIPPNGSSGEQPLTSPSEKGGLVLEGSIFMTVGDKQAKLLEGDSFIFDGQSPHSFHNPGPGSAKVLWIISNVPISRHL